MRRRRSLTILPALFLILILLMPAVLAVSRAGSRNPSADAETEILGSGRTLRKVTVSVPGLDRTYRLLLVSDLHIIVPDDPEVDEESREEVSRRMDQMFLSQTPEGQTAWQQWKTLPRELDGYAADMILFSGDMIDFATKESVRCLKEGFDSLRTPWMYVRGDHDYGAWYSREYESQKDAIALQAEAAPRSKVMRQKTGDLTVIGWDNNTTQITEEGLRDLYEYLEEAKDESSPVLFLCHVPMKGTAGEELADETKEKWGRVLLWGDDDCTYQPDKTTVRAIDAVLSDDSPVMLEAAGHIHFPYKGSLTGRSTLVVGDPAYLGIIDELVLEPAGQTDHTEEEFQDE